VLVRIVRELTPEEVLRRIKRYEKEFGLLYSLVSLKVESISDLARKLKRNVKNVYQDLQILKKLGFVEFRKRGKRNIVPETLVEEITFLVR